MCTSTPYTHVVQEWNGVGWEDVSAGGTREECDELLWDLLEEDDQDSLRILDRSTEENRVVEIYI